MNSIQSGGKPTFIDCQGFAGGMTLGLVQSGLKLVGKREHAGGFGVANCEANRHLLGNDWEAESSAADDWTPKSVDIVAGNPPCSGFSIASPKEFRGVDSRINQCMWDFTRFAARCRPAIAVFESVRSAFSAGRSLMQALRAELESLTGERYTLTHTYHNAYDLGGVAVRPRYFWVVSRVPFGMEWPQLHSRPTLWDVIEDLVPLNMTMNFQPRWSERGWWVQEQLDAFNSTELHQVDGHVTARDNPHQTRLREMFAYADEIGFPMRQGETIFAYMKRMYEQTNMLPPPYRNKLDHFLRRDFVMGFINPMRWYADKSAKVVDGATLDRGIHPTLPRTFTHREVARIMGFPDDWRISTIQASPNALMSTWGKGITVQCGRWLGEWLQASLAGEPGSITGELIGEREYFISPPGKNAIRSTSPQNTRRIRSVSMPKPRPVSPVEGDTPATQEATVTSTDTTEATATVTAASTDGNDDKGAGRRGRPRPSATLERDAKVDAFLLEYGAQAWTIQDLSSALEVVYPGEFAPNVVKACLDRLSWGEGNKVTPVNPRVVKLSRTAWRHIDHTDVVLEATSAPQTATAEATNADTEQAQEAAEEAAEEQLVEAGAGTWE